MVRTVTPRACRAPAPCPPGGDEPRRPARRGPVAKSDDPALVGDGQQGTADPDCSRLREWLPAPRWRSARRCAEHRGGACVRAPSQGNTGRYAVNPHRRSEHGATHDDRSLSASSSAEPTSSRSASTRSTTASTTPRQEAKARREDVRLRRRTRRGLGGHRRRLRRRGRRGLRRSPRPTRTRRKRTRSPAPRSMSHPPRVTGGRGAGRPAAISATAPRQQLVLDRAQAPRGPLPDRVRRASSTARWSTIGPGVHPLVDEVDGHAEDLHPVLEGLLDGPRRPGRRAAATDGR
jgi:hypothetical protein